MQMVDTENYFRCWFTNFVMSNIETWRFPPNTGRSLSSALIMRRSLASCRLFFFMYIQSFFVTSVRGIGLVPTTAPSCSLGCIGFMNAAFGVRFAPDFLVADLRDFFADFEALFMPLPRLADFFDALFFVARPADFFDALFLVAIDCLSRIVGT